MNEPRESDDKAIQPSPSTGRVGLSKNWAWFLGLGVALDLLGVFALGSASFLSIQFLGWLLVLCGILRGLHALKYGAPYFIDFASALLFALVGLLLVLKPGTTTVTNTLAIAALMMLDGALQIAGSIIARYPKWRWLLVHGMLVLMLGLGLAIWQQVRQPISPVRVWVIAWLIGITMLINGGSFIIQGWATRKTPEESSTT